MSKRNRQYGRRVIQYKAQKLSPIGLLGDKAEFYASPDGATPETAQIAARWEQEIRARCRETLPKIGTPPAACDLSLQHGAFGAVWQVQENLVLKITTDFSEAIAATKVWKAQRKHPNWPKIFGVWAYGTKTSFGIIVEFLEDLPRDVRRLWATDEIRSVLNGLFYPNPHIRAAAEIEKMQAIGRGQIFEFTQKLNNLDLGYGPRFQRLMGGLRELRSLGVWPHDLTSHNIGINRSGEWVVRDLGVSSYKRGVVYEQNEVPSVDVLTSNAALLLRSSI